MALPSGATKVSSPANGFSAANRTCNGAPFHGETGAGKTAISALSSQGDGAARAGEVPSKQTTPNSAIGKAFAGASFKVDNKPHPSMCALRQAPLNHIAPLLAQTWRTPAPREAKLLSRRRMFQSRLRDFVDRHFAGDAFERGLLRAWRNAGFGQQRCRLRVVDHRLGGEHGVRDREPLHPGGDVDRLAEIIEPVIEHDGKARTLMDADFENEVFAARLLANGADRGAHPQ